MMPEGSTTSHKRTAWNKSNIDVELIFDLYFIKKLSAMVIAKMIGSNSKSILNRLSKLGKIRNNSESHLGQKPWNYKGEIKKTNGYWYVKVSHNHPYYDMANKYGYISKHRLIMATYLGRCLDKTEIVHHIDGNKDNCTIDNLELYVNHSIHMKCHMTSDEARIRGQNGGRNRWKVIAAEAAWQSTKED